MANYVAENERDTMLGAMSRNHFATTVANLHPLCDFFTEPSNLLVPPCE